MRTARKPVDDLKRASDEYSAAAPRLTTVANKLNQLENMAAHNPRGAEPVGTPGRDEGYLYWAAWLGHNGDSVFSSEDANGLYRRITLNIGCDQILNLVAAEPGGAPDPLRSMVTGFTETIRNQLCPE